MPTSIALKAAIGALMVDSIIELSFITSMVAWLHETASGAFAVIADENSTFELKGEPLNLLVDQGHTSNGAAGTAFVLIGIGGILSLWLRSRGGRFGTVLHLAWLVLNILALLLTLAAVAYVFAVTNAHRGQVIDVVLAQTLQGNKYPLDSWTPQNWFSAVLDLDLADDAVRSDIVSHLRVMRGWQYNLIPLFIIQLVETVLAVMDGLRWRKDAQYAGVAQEKVERS